MPVYNGAAFLDAALNSILGQASADFEVLVIDDGSTDDSAIRVAARRDARIRLLRQPENLGLVAALNRGLDEALGEYVARMDADDVSLPQRFARQLAFLDSHPEVGVCGSWMEAFSPDETTVWTAPVDHDRIRCRLLFESVLYHPTVIMRREMLERHGLRYDPHYPHAEDYELWCRCVRHFRLANLDEVLLRYRIHDASVGGRKRAEKLTTASRIRARLLDELGLAPTPDELAVHEAMALWETPAERVFLNRAEAWLLRLQAANRERAIYAEPLFNAVLAERWYHSCEQASSLGTKALRAWEDSPFRTLHAVPFQRRLRFWGKCLMRK
jgi:glycosyltransferase involved in cell wall biosynthesis